MKTQPNKGVRTGMMGSLITAAALVCSGCATTPTTMAPAVTVAEGCGIHDPNRGATTVITGCLDNKQIAATRQASLAEQKADIDAKAAVVNEICGLSLKKADLTPECVAAMVSFWDQLTLERGSWLKSVQTMKEQATPK